jgi:hypothetical protein
MRRAVARLEVEQDPPVDDPEREREDEWQLSRRHRAVRVEDVGTGQGELRRRALAVVGACRRSSFAILLSCSVLLLSD